MKQAFMQRHQPHWDWRAAANFICGGAGAGLLAFVLLLVADAASNTVLLVLGLGLIGAGLFFVALEIGRPLRALNVFVHLRRSWMSREALAAAFLFVLGAGLLAGMHWRAWPMAVVALVFLYCQARILRESRAIPAWREPLGVPLLMATGLAEGAGLFWALSAWAQPPASLLVAFGALVAVRWVLWHAWRTKLDAKAPRAALRVIDESGWTLQHLGGAAALALIVLGGIGAFPSPWASACLAAAGALVAVSGAVFKFNLVTRAGHHQGFVLPRLPVRGVPR